MVGLLRMERTVTLYKAYVENYELVVRQVNAQWAIIIRDLYSGHYIDPIHDFANSLEEGQLRACRRACEIAGVPTQQSAVGDPCQALLELWKKIELPSVDV